VPGAGRLGPRRHFAETIPILRPPGHVYAYMVHRCKHGANPHASHVYCSTARASGALYSLLYYTGSPTLYSCYNCGRHFRFHFKGFLDGFTAQEKKIIRLLVHFAIFYLDLQNNFILRYLNLRKIDEDRVGRSPPKHVFI